MEVTTGGKLSTEKRAHQLAQLHFSKLHSIFPPPSAIINDHQHAIHAMQIHAIQIHAIQIHAIQIHAIQIHLAELSSTFDIHTEYSIFKAQPSVVVPGSAPRPSISEGTIWEKRFLRLLTTAVELASCRHPTSPQRASTFPEETQNSLYATVHVMPRGSMSTVWTLLLLPHTLYYFISHLDELNVIVKTPFRRSKVDPAWREFVFRLYEDIRVVIIGKNRQETSSVPIVGHAAPVIAFASQVGYRVEWNGLIFIHKHLNKI